MKTSAALVKMKLAVHWAPSVNIITPGWIGAEAAGAQVGAACTADGAAPKPIASAAMAVVATATSRRIVPLPTEYLPIEPAGEGFALRSEEHTSELQSLMRTPYAVFCLKNKNITNTNT